MSKRSYRRLAVVAGTALALGSMAPAMALRVGGAGVADVDIETVDVVDVVGDVQEANLLPLGTIIGPTGAVSAVRGTVSAAAGTLLLDVYGLLNDAQCVADAGLGLTVGLTANVGLGIGLGGVGGTGLLQGSLDSVEGVQECVGSIVDGALDTAGHAGVAVQAVGGIAVGTALGAVGTVQALPQTVVGMVTPLLLDNLLTITADASANAVLGAGLASLF